MSAAADSDAPASPDVGMAATTWHRHSSSTKTTGVRLALRRRCRPAAANEAMLRACITLTGPPQI